MNFFLTALSFLLISTNAFSSLKISTYNIRNFDSKASSTNKKELSKILKGIHFDILQVEEIVNTSSFKKFIKTTFPKYKVVLSTCGGGGRQKVGFVFNPRKVRLLKHSEDLRLSSFDSIFGKYGCGSYRPALIGHFVERKTRRKFIVVGVHLKAGGSETSFATRFKQYRILKKILDEMKRKGQRNIIVLGDFNTTGYNIRNLDYTKFTDLLSDLRFETTAKRMDCSAYWSGEDRQDNIEESSILDHIIYPNKFLNYKKISVKIGTHCAKVKCANVSSSNLGISYKEVSDHCPVIATFQ